VGRHGVEKSVSAIMFARDNCFKVDGHLMPDLPSTTVEKDFEMIEKVRQVSCIGVRVRPPALARARRVSCTHKKGNSLRLARTPIRAKVRPPGERLTPPPPPPPPPPPQVFGGEELQLDYCKLYPCLDLPYTLSRTWKETGVWKPIAEHDFPAFLDLLRHAMAVVPPWVRVNRVQVRLSPCRFFNASA
jgi:histone acetyltransferase (RNA polymerase elongator complex component)